MKTFTLFLALALTTLFTNAQQTVTVTIDNVLNDKGNVVVTLHNAETFMKAKPIQTVGKKAEKGKMTFTLENVKADEYAIIILHDVNENNRMDFQTNGMPKENYATSGITSFGPPNFGDAKFKVEDKDVDLNIRF